MFHLATIVFVFWLAQQQQVSAKPPSYEVQALQSLYNSTNGTYWTNKSNSGLVWSFNDTEEPNPCYPIWQGIACDADGSHIVTLNLTEYNMQGPLPSDLDQLTELQFLDMSSNLLLGPLPPSLFNLTRLQFMYLYNNSITGSIPDIGNTTSLLKLVLRTNALKGPLEALCNLTGLEFLGLSNNYFSGDLPACIGEKMRNLTYLAMKNNSLFGQLPTSLCELAGLQKLILHKNRFTGSLPACIGSMTSLQDLAIYSNAFDGSLPPSICRMSSLQFFFAYDNKFVGALPGCLGNITSLTGLWLYNNSIDGSLPSSMCTLSKLQSLLVYNNNITGSLPACIGDMEGLAYLDANSNAISGSLPRSLCKLKKLRSLVLSENMLTGHLPACIGESESLEYLELYDNFLGGPLPALRNMSVLSLIDVTGCHLVGPIPDLPPSLEYLYLGDNFLTSTVPSTIGQCTNLNQVDLSDNDMTGTLPQQAIGSLRFLQTLLLFGNKFTGHITNLVDASLQSSLQTIDISQNRFSGDLPTEVFRLPALSTFAAAENCLRGALPIEVCYCTNLTTLVLDGLSTADTCVDYIFGSKYSGYTLREKTILKGGVPTCLFNSLSLVTLHLSGNGITGSLPSDAEYPLTLQDLSLSHNLITGPIPYAVQSREWRNLDLSFNKIKGEIRDFEGLSWSSSNASVTLQVNRLSGVIPSSLTHAAAAVNILEGNVFACTLDRNTLPPQDPLVEGYECGSSVVNISLYAWLACAAILLAVFVAAMCTKATTSVRASASGSATTITDLKVATTTTEVLSAKIGIAVDRVTRSGLALPVIDSFFRNARRFFALLTVFIVAVAMVVYLAVHHFYSNYKHTYAWSVSVAYLHGTVACVAVCVVSFAFWLLVAYLWHALLAVGLRDADKEKTTFLSTTSSTEANSGNYVDGKAASTTISGINGGKDEGERFGRELEENVNAARTGDVTRRRSRRSLCEVLFNLFLGIVNIVVVTVCNVTYLWVYVNRNNSQTIMTQIALSIFKALWNQHAVFWLVSAARAAKTKGKNPLASPPAVASDADSCSSTLLGGDDEEMANSSSSEDVGESAKAKAEELLIAGGGFTNAEVRTIVAMQLFNVVVSPFFVYAFVSKTCFNAAFIPPDSVVSSYTYYTLTFDVNFLQEKANFDLLPSLFSRSISFVPPFQYTYQCSSSFLSAYSAVIVFMFLQTGFVMPCLHLSFKAIHTWLLAENRSATGPIASTATRNDSGNSTGADVDAGAASTSTSTPTSVVNGHVTSPSASQATAAQIVAMLMTRLLHPIVAIADDDDESEVLSPQPGIKNKNRPTKLFEKTTFQVQLITSATLMLTFGLVFPPLAVVICVSVWCETFFTQTLMKRLVAEAEGANAATGRMYRQILEKDTDGIFLPFRNSLLQRLLIVSALFVSCFVFDTLGDSYDWRAGLAVVGAMMAVGVSLVVIPGYSRNYCGNHREGEWWSGTAVLLKRFGFFCGSLEEGGAKGESKKDTQKSLVVLRESLLCPTSEEDALLPTYNPMLLESRWSASKGKSSTGSSDSVLSRTSFTLAATSQFDTNGSC